MWLQVVVQLLEGMKPEECKVRLFTQQPQDQPGQLARPQLQNNN